MNDEYKIPKYKAKFKGSAQPHFLISLYEFDDLVFEKTHNKNNPTLIKMLSYEPIYLHQLDIKPIKERLEYFV